MILRPYQTRSVEFLQDKTRGFVKAPAGSGKTIIGANAVAKKIKPGQRCSWLANTHEQVEQAIKALSSTEGPQGVEFDIRCAAGSPDVSGADILVIDEAHRMMAPTWFATASACCGIIWGLSATPWGTDPERNAALVEFFGGMENFIEIPREEVMAGGSLAKGLVFMYDLDVQGQFDDEIAAKVAVEVARRCKRFWNIPKFEHERRATWQITQETVQQNRVRNAHACHTIRTAVSAGKSVLTLVGSIVHGEEIAQQVEGSVMAHSKMGAKKRRDTIAAFRDGSLKSLIATQLADEGLDVPIASELVLLAGGRSAAKIEQRSGRVMRPHGDKEFGVVHDYLDRGAKFAFAQAIARQKTYSNLGYEITRVKP